MLCLHTKLVSSSYSPKTAAVTPDKDRGGAGSPAICQLCSVLCTRGGVLAGPCLMQNDWSKTLQACHLSVRCRYVVCLVMHPFCTSLLRLPCWMAYVLESET